MTIKDELIALVSDDGMLRVGDVVDWARSNPGSLLHGHFVWDDKLAGHQYRLDQARHLIALYVITPERKPEMISLRIDRVRPGGGYRFIDEVMQKRSLRDAALSDALADLERVRVKYEHLVELADVWSEVDQVKRRKERKEAKRRKRGGEGLSPQA